MTGESDADDSDDTELPPVNFKSNVAKHKVCAKEYIILLQACGGISLVKHVGETNESKTSNIVSSESKLLQQYRTVLLDSDNNPIILSLNNNSLTINDIRLLVHQSHVSQKVCH